MKIADPQLDRFFRENPDFDVTTFDFIANQTALHGKNISADSATAMAALQSYQRLLELSDSQHVVYTLRQNGFHSAHQIAAMPAEQFVSRTSHWLDGALASQVHARALDIKHKITHLWANLMAARGGSAFAQWRGATVDEDTLGEIQALPSYKDMFGNQNYCQCESCKSIFGPAAYYVDIMRITDRYVSKTNETTIPPGYALSERRHDLFTLPLSCATTNDLLPYLTIVNKTLAKHIAEESKQDDVARYLATTTYPFVAPHNQPLRRVRLTLGSLDLSLAVLYASTSGLKSEDPSALAREYLQLSSEQASFVATPITGTPGLQLAWGLRTAGLDTLNQLEVFSRQSGLTRAHITELTRQELSAAEFDAGLAHNFWFNLSLPDSQAVCIVLGTTAPDTIAHLDSQTLDAINRYVRLSRWSGISFANLGYALSSLRIGALDAHALHKLATAQGVVQALGWSWARASVLWNVMSTSGRYDADVMMSVFDWVWNNPVVRGDGAIYHPEDNANPLYTDEEIVDWHVAESKTSDNRFNISRLRAGLQLDASNLIELATLAFPDEDIVPLNVPNLSTLYRIASLAQACQLDIADFGMVAGWLQLDLTEPLPADAVSLLLLFATWLQQVALDPQELAFFVDQEALPESAGLTAPVYADMQVIWSQAANVLFAPAQLLGDTVDAERALLIYAALLLLTPTLLIEVGEAYKRYVPNAPAPPLSLVPRRVDAQSLEPLRKSPLSLTAAQVQQIVTALNTAHDAQVEILNSGLAGLLDSSATSIAALGGLITAQPGAPTWIGRLLRPSAASCEEWKQISDTLGALLRLDMACRALGIADAVVVAITSNPGAFGVTLSELFSLDTVRALTRYVDTRLRLRLTDETYLPYLATPDDSTCKEGKKAQALCLLTGWPQNDLCGVVTALDADATLYSDTEGLSRLATIFDLLARGGFNSAAYKIFLASRQWNLSGVDGENHWQKWKDLADTCEGAAAAFLGKTWPDKQADLQPTLLEAQRDALLPTLLWYFQVSHKEITTPDRLSSYLLLDVQMGGGNQTSQVVEATGAVQMYLNRARANLEPGIEHLPIPHIWWEWLTTYRTWEANRKVFLYPENYLIPTLRSSSTTLFQALESDLMQVNITPERVTAAYRTYMQGLDQLASLQFVDAFRCTVIDSQRGDIDTLFQFARTSTAPYEYYWTKQERGAAWAQWSRIDVTIKSPYVTPVYAFGRLFVFWVETSVVSSTAIETDKGDTRSKNSVVHKAAIRYSFMDASGKWVGDQTLAPEQVVYVAPNEVKLSPQSGYGIFDMNNLFWHKCNVQVFSSKAPIGPNSDVRIDEKIAVLYGPFLENSSNGTKITVNAPDVGSQRNPAVVQFELDTYRRCRIVNQAIASNIRGVVSLREPLVLNRELQRDYLFMRTEFLNFADNYATGVPPTLRPLYDYAMNRLYAQPTLNVFRNNYYGDWNNTIETAALRSQIKASTLLFRGVDANAAQKIIDDLQAAGYVSAAGDGNYTVAPGFNDNADFGAILFGAQSRDEDIIRQWIKRCLLVANIEQHAVQVTTFQMTALGEFAADQALKDLRAEGIVADDGYVTPAFSSRTNLASILIDAPDHASIEFALRSILFIAMGSPLLLGALANRTCTTYVVKNQPALFVGNVGTESYLIAPDTERGPCMDIQARVVGLTTSQSITKASFISSDISTAESATVFDQLFNKDFINADGYLLRPFRGEEDLSFLFDKEPAQSRQIKTAQVRVVLIDLPTMTRVSYYAENDDIIITDTSFIRMGLSAAQSKHVFDTLRLRKVIGPQGYISPNYDPLGDLGDLFPDEPPEKAALLTADVAVVLQGYVNNTWRRGIQDLSYRFTRLTTGAVPRLTTALQVGGVDALLDLRQQQAPVVPQVPFSSYGPGERVVPPGQGDAAQVDFEGVYGIYFWELFFFTPRLIADALFQAGDFPSALRWLQYIFNPTQRLSELSPRDFGTPDIDEAQAKQAFDALKVNGVIRHDNQVARSYTSKTNLSYLFPSVTEKPLRTRMIEEVRNVLFNHQTADLGGQFWRFQPFRNHTQQSLVATLTNPVQIALYNSDPYDPYAIAQLRIGAFEKATYCNYIDVLVAWGDSFFQRKTREYLNAAYLLYVMASDLLGPRPEPVGPCTDQLPVTFEKILERYNDDPSGIPQFLIEMENLLAVRGSQLPTPQLAGGAFNDVDALFCVPHNDMLLARWDIVEDRLFKVRNSLDLDGNPLLLPLFAAPIDPLALVRAAAAAGSSGGFAQLAMKPPTAQVFRFPTLIGNARGVVGDLQMLGGELEQALTAQSSEAFMILQSTHEQRLDRAQLLSFEKRTKGAQSSLEALQASRAITEQRRKYYADLASNGMIAAEILSITFGLASRIASFSAIGFETGAAIFALAPQVGSPFAMTYGGKQVELGLHRTAGTLNQVSTVFDTAKDLTDSIGQFQRLKAEWEQQKSEAEKELVQIDKQIAAAQAEVASANADYAAHQVSMDNAKAQQAFLQNKFDNPDYYAWRVSRASALYYQAYQLALKAVDAAQSSLQWALASTENYLASDPWDPSRRGLMAGNSLNLALDRMEFAYSQKDILRQEITKEILLSQINPAQLLRLRSEGVADFELSEALFDFDFPSHYCRRIKTLEVSLLPVDENGAFEEAHAIIIQTHNKILRLPTPAGLQYMLDNSGDPGDAVWQDWRANQTVSLSRRAMADGAFIEYFGDGEKLQRFEGTGAVSHWRYQLPKATNQFDFSAIEDVKLTLRYTALDAGATYQRRVEEALSGSRYSAALMLNMVAVYEDRWNEFIDDTASAKSQTLSFDVANSLFPPHTTGLVVDEVIVAMVVGDGISLPASASFMSLSAGDQAVQAIPTLGLAGRVTYAQVGRDAITGRWNLTFNLDAMKANKELARLLDPDGHISADALLNIFLSVQFTASVFK
ncbi:hypothetical protein DWU98_04675 [Dyella monticola]|uniref:Toxin n=1 Tax=Dyella monticola TaxID=1927958 RepID=A0A370X5C2_9GAMM|nr:neuraminidase-like domain-containing protein [Dyella monticola]RDS83629.1 hypothetical protein DWU98_04675 [Dyella monticola]